MNKRCVWAAGLVLVGVAGVGRGDWPGWRGAYDDGFVRYDLPIKEWSPEGKNLLWKLPIGGRTTPIVMNGRVFFNAPGGEGERRHEQLVCLDAFTGKQIWDYAFNVFHTDIVENRVGWTAPVGDPLTGNVYVHGTGGELLAFNRDGRVLWKVSLTEMFGRISGYGGRLHNPVVDENRVLIAFSNSNWGDMAAPRHRILALDKNDGKVLWWTGPGEQPADPTTYATPVVAVIDGVRQIIFANGEGNVYGLRARSGEEIWKYKFSKRGLNVTPLVHGQYVIVAHSEENWDNTEMGRVACLDGNLQGDITGKGEVWRADGVGVGYASPAYSNGRVYLVDNSANLICLDVGTGSRYWTYSLGRVGKGSPVVTSEGYIYVSEQNGTFHILQDLGDECLSWDRDEFKRDDQLVDEMFGSPAVDGGRIYFQTRYGTYCLGASGQTVAPPKPPVKTPETSNAAYTGSVQVTPAEITLSPGERITFEARQLSADTIFTRTVAPLWTVKGPRGSIAKGGEFVAADDNVHSAGQVIATFEGKEYKARVRVVPKLPFEVTFEDLAVDSVPPGWVGAPRKMKVVERDGGKVLMKLAEDPAPPFMRVQPYITAPIEGGFVIQGDLLGGMRETASGTKFLPDMGLVNSRYNLTLQGTDQVLRMESWSTMPRIRKEIPLAWPAGVWYRMKFAVAVREKDALVKAKVWKRDEPEPTGWTMEMTDPFPNREGSAGLYGFSPGTTPKSKGPEVYYDNVKVFKDE